MIKIICVTYASGQLGRINAVTAAVTNAAKNADGNISKNVLEILDNMNATTFW